ncbi:MAG: hypothetical protein Q8R92_21015 [Deltaproteobacteria bacterium]|nr:hypothetical protein [Deltaproteobacteria bacterium]
MSHLVPPRVRADAAALTLARLGTDAARARQPAFRSVGHAATWYFTAQRRHSAAKTSLGAATEILELGTFVDGGRGSVVEGSLCLLADVHACLPEPRGEPSSTSVEWQKWVVFLACLRDGHDIEGAAGKVRELFDAACEWSEARALLLVAVRDFRDSLRRKGLLR